jgi:hypothetical protein
LREKKKRVYVREREREKMLISPSSNRPLNFELSYAATTKSVYID